MWPISGSIALRRFRGYAVYRRTISTSSRFMPSMRSRQVRMFFRHSIRSCDLARSAMSASPLLRMADHEISGRRRPLSLEAHARAGRKAGRGQHCDRALFPFPSPAAGGFERVNLPMERLRGSTMSVDSVQGARMLFTEWRASY